LTEHYAEILADAGIADRVHGDLWRGIIRELTGAIKEGRIADGLMAAVQRSGAILAEHAPSRPGDEDELPNKVILL
jgi:putative membrane protein